MNVLPLFIKNDRQSDREQVLKYDKNARYAVDKVKSNISNIVQLFSLPIAINFYEHYHDHENEEIMIFVLFVLIICIYKIENYLNIIEENVVFIFNINRFFSYIFTLIKTISILMIGKIVVGYINYNVLIGVWNPVLIIKPLSFIILVYFILVIIEKHYTEINT